MLKSMEKQTANLSKSGFNAFERNAGKSLQDVENRYKKFGEGIKRQELPWRSAVVGLRCFAI